MNNKFDISINKSPWNISISTIYNGKRCAAEISAHQLNTMDKSYYFNRLIVHSSLRNQGIATALMKTLVQVLDEEKITLLCDVNPYGDLTLEQLVLFYSKFGFIKDQNYDSSEQLIRNYKV